MRRIVLSVAFSSVALLALASTPAFAQQEFGDPRPQAVRPQTAPMPTSPPRHRRYVVSGFGVWVRTDGPGYPAYRYTYRGETYGAQRPAIFQYGYEHEMQENGPYSLNGQWH